MHIILAPDSFKESLSAIDVASAMGRGAVRACEGRIELTLAELPIADGGEGTVDCLVAATGGAIHHDEVTDPLGRPVMARWGTLGDGRTAVIEMAAASGLPLVEPDRRDPLLTTTWGTGELIRKALDRGLRRILIGIGGSATVDGGIGMAQALGAHMLDEAWQPVGRGGAALERIAHVSIDKLDPRIRDAEIFVATDVRNPLTGPTGAAVVFGPQKGAGPEAVQRLDRGLANLARRFRDDLGIDIETMPGAGAAGGLGAGLVAVLGVTLRSGIELVLETIHFDAHLAQADLVLTGEGALDGQSLHGKATIGVARAAKAAEVPCIAVAGRLGDQIEATRAEGIVAAYGLVNDTVTVAEAMCRAAELVEERSRQAVEEFLRGDARLA